MQLDRNYPPYFDGRNLDQITAKIQENQEKSQTVIVKPEIPTGKSVQLRYPHPLDELFLNLSGNHYKKFAKTR